MLFSRLSFQLLEPFLNQLGYYLGFLERNRGFSLQYALDNQSIWNQLSNMDIAFILGAIFITFSYIAFRIAWRTDADFQKGWLMFQSNPSRRNTPSKRRPLLFTDDLNPFDQLATWYLPQKFRRLIDETFAVSTT